MSGLDGVVAAETVLSLVDGMAGRLVLRGVPVEALAEAQFEDAAALLWRGFVPGTEDAAALQAAFGRQRVRAFALLPPLLAAAALLPAIDAFRAMLAGLPEEGPELATAALAVFVAALARRQAGLAPVPPDPALGQAADLLRMARGGPAPTAHVRALDTYLVTVADHGMNASTFTARVIASTGSNLVSALTGAFGALAGPLHGGAPGPVLDLLDALAGEADLERALAARLAAGERLMGFGHRIYRVRDPRAEVLRRAVRRLDSPRIAFAETVEAAALAALGRAKPGRRLETNVEFYTALLLDALGLDRTLFTPVFAAGRVLGWTAHVAEQRQSGRIIRPESRYVGPEAPLAA